MHFTPQHREQLFSATNGRLTKATLPVLSYVNQRLQLSGSGVFLKIGDRDFILTAAHVLDLNVFHGIPLTLGPEHNGGPPIPLNGAQIWCCEFPAKGDINDPDARLADPFDIGFVALTTAHAKCLSNLRAPITLQDLDFAEKPDAGCFLFLGYPGDYAQSSLAIGRVSVELLRYFTKLDTENVPDNKINVLFQYTPDSVHCDGTVAELPDVDGMSGCGVWRLSRLNSFEQWGVNDVKLVATEHEWNRVKYFVRATPIVHTIKAIYRQFPELRKIIDVNVGIQSTDWL